MGVVVNLWHEKCSIIKLIKLEKKDYIYCYARI